MTAFIILVDDECRVTMAEGTGLGHFGLRWDEVLGRKSFELFAAWPALSAGMEDALSGRPGRATVRAGGMAFDAHFEPRLSEQGDPRGGLLFAETGARTPAEEELARSEGRLAEAQRLAHVGSWEWDVLTNTVHWSEELYRVYGIDASLFDPTYQGFLARVFPEDRAHTEAVIRAAFDKCEPFVYDHRIVRGDGSVRMLHTRGDVVTNAKGIAVRMAGACWDVTELWQWRREREHAISLLKATLESTADGLLVVDLHGRITAYNQRLLELWNLPADAMDNTDFERLIDAVDRQLTPESRAACLRHVRAMQVDIAAESYDSLVFIDGRFFERYSRPQRVGDEIVGRVWSYRDVTTREQLLREAQAALAVRDEFLAVVAHEIRGPMTSLHLATQQLRKGTSQATSERLLEIIERDGRRIDRFIGELVDLVRVRRGELEFRFEPVDLAEVVRSTASQLAAEAARAGSRVSVVAPRAIVGNWDRTRLEQIATNLLSNAIKFGSGNPIELAVDSDGTTARLTVRDQGIGIPPEVQDKLFEPFERGVGPHRYGGLGLGLYIVRILANGMGGSVHLDSNLDIGSTFTVELPLGRES